MAKGCCRTVAMRVCFEPHAPDYTYRLGVLRCYVFVKRMTALTLYRRKQKSIF
jgi:hypothetical protein